MSVEGRPTRVRDVVPEVELGRLRQIKFTDYLPRFALGATVSVCAALIVKVAGARFGGMFLAFPAILPASITLIKHEEGTRLADRNAIGAILGGFALCVFAISVEKTLARIPPGVALVLALLAWMLASLLLYALLAALRPDECDKRKDTQANDEER